MKKEEKTVMGKLTGVTYIKFFLDDYFTFDELKCKCGCNTFWASKRFMRMLYNMRVCLSGSIFVTSCYRCEKHPQYSENHDGYAIDVFYRPRSSVERGKLILSGIHAGFKRIGIAKNFIHFDCNPDRDGKPDESVIWIYPGVYNK